MPPTGEGTDLAYGAARRGRSGREGAEGRRRPGWQPESPTMVKSGAGTSNTRRGCTPVEPGHEEGGQMAEMMAESAQPTVPPSDDRILASGDESGTAPGIGLSAPMSKVSVPSPFSSWYSSTHRYPRHVRRVRRGGRVLCDLRFRHHGSTAAGRASTGRTSILSFYGRRRRRIIPAATLVIIATVDGLLVPRARRRASDCHRRAVGCRLLWPTSISSPPERTTWPPRAPPSPLQNFWSLAVEEQFYLIYPTLFLLVAAARVRTLLGKRWPSAWSVVISVSFAYSIVDTHSNSSRCRSSRPSPGPGSWPSAPWSPSAPRGS